VEAFNKQLSSIVERVLKQREQVPKLVEDSLTKQLQEEDPLRGASNSSEVAPVDNNDMLDLLQNVEDNIKEDSSIIATIKKTLPATLTKATTVLDTAKVVASSLTAPRSAIPPPSAAPKTIR